MERLEVAVTTFTIVLILEFFITFQNPTLIKNINDTPTIHKFKCSKKCKTINNLPEMKNRNKLAPLIPDKRPFTHNESRVILFTKDLSDKQQQNYYQQAEKYISEFWNTQIKNGIEIKIPDSSQYFKNVPELYHYTWFSCHDFKFINFLSMYSVYHNFESKHAKIIFHTDCEPINSFYWILFKSIAEENNRLIIQQIKIFDKIWNKKLVHVEHVSDVYRILLLSKFGGIYCDDDMIFLKSHGDLFNTKVPIMGDAQRATIANGFIITPKSPKIFLKWLIEYKEYMPVKQNWDWFSVRKIWSLWRMYPDEINVLDGKLVRPGAMELDLIFGGYYDWRDSYNVHIYKRSFGKYGINVDSFEDIDCLKYSVGEILRKVAYGSTDFC